MDDFSKCIGGQGRERRVGSAGRIALMRPNTLLKRARELRGWSQARVAEEIGTTALNVGRWERGTSMPYPHFREKLCILFGKDARELGLLEMEDGTEEAASGAEEEEALTGTSV